MKFLSNFIGCKGQKICKCDIFLEAELIDVQKGKIFVSGKNKSVDFDIAVRNTGIEPAYGTKIELSTNFDLPEEIASTGETNILFTRIGVRMMDKDNK